MSAQDRSQAQESDLLRSYGELKLWDMKVILIGKSLRFTFKKDFLTHVHPWQMHVDVWQNQYNIVK